MKTPSREFRTFKFLIIYSIIVGIVIGVSMFFLLVKIGKDSGLGFIAGLLTYAFIDGIKEFLVKIDWRGDKK